MSHANAAQPLPRPSQVYLAQRPPGLKYMMGGCGIAGCISLDGRLIAGDRIRAMLTIMEERENGLGAGYACYGLFPSRKDQYCLQFFFDDEKAKERAEDMMRS